jgi:proteasome accessory factor C
MSPRPQAEEELTRVLALVPWIIAHPGSTKAEIANRFGISVRQLELDLVLVMMVGVPPYSPGDYIDVDPDADPVEIRLADYFTRPLRLSPAEGLALLAAGRGLLAVPGSDPTGPLATALDKLQAALSGADVAVDVGHPEFLDDVRSAAQEGRRLEIEYFSATEGQLTTRAIDPGPPFFAVGHWYTDAYCHLRRESRMFRLDRIRAVRDTGERFEPSEDQDPARRDVYRPNPDDERVTLVLPPEAAWVAETTPVESIRELPGGGLEVTLPVGSTTWLARLLLQIGAGGRVAEPAERRGLAAGAARRVLDRYAGGARHRAGA